MKPSVPPLIAFHPGEGTILAHPTASSTVNFLWSSGPVLLRLPLSGFASSLWAAFLVVRHLSHCQCLFLQTLICPQDFNLCVKYLWHQLCPGSSNQNKLHSSCLFLSSCYVAVSLLYLGASLFVKFCS